MFAMIKLHFAAIWSQRAGLAAAAFCLVLMCTAMGFAGWFDSPLDILHAFWICLAASVFSAVQIVLTGVGRRGEFFSAQGLLEIWLWGQFAAVFLSILPLIAAASAVILSISDALSAAAAVLDMVLFSAIACHAMIINLEGRLMAISDTRRRLVMLVIAGPWVLPAWLLGMQASSSALSCGEWGFPTAAMCVLALIQWAMNIIIKK